MSIRKPGLLVALVLVTGSLAPAAAAPVSPGNSLPEGLAATPIEKAQVFYWQGRRYCFYWDGWKGPGWYRCGYHLRDGFGWGGGPGWHGWHHGPRPPHKKGLPPPPPPKKGLPPPPKKGPPPPVLKKGPPPIPKKGPPPILKKGPPPKKGP